MLYIQFQKQIIGDTIKNEFGDVISSQTIPINGFELVSNNMGSHTDMDVFGGETYFTSSNGKVYRIDEYGFPRDFLSVPANSTSQGGLLGIAFKGTNVYLSVNVGGDWQLWEVPRILGNPVVDDKRVVLSFSDSTGAHQGGWIGFGEDGFLYITLGDNGDPSLVNDLSQPWGKLLRIDVANVYGEQYSVPSGNPYNTSIDPITKLIVGYGLNNPWRCMFYGNNLYIGDAQNGDKGTPTKQNVWKVTSNQASMSMYVLKDSPLFSYVTPFHGKIILGAINNGELTPDSDQLMFADISSRSLYIWDAVNGVSTVKDIVLPSNVLTFSRGADGTIYSGVANGNLYKMSSVL